MNHYNRSAIFILLIFFTTITSCKKSFLEENLQSNYTAVTGLTDSLGLTAGIAGLQKLVRDQYSVGAQGVITPQGTRCVTQVGTDVCRNGGSGADPVQIPYEDYSLNAQDIPALNFWRWGYRVINAANLIIEQTEDPNTSLSDGARKLFSAEAKFFRAYAYNFLSTLFGGVPLVDKPSKSPKTDFVKASQADILKLMISDLSFASANLPDITVTTGTKADRINKYAALQLLGLTYIRNNNAALAEQSLQTIIDSARFRLTTSRYGLKSGSPGDPFSDMFIIGNMRRSEGNREAIWVIEQIFNVPGGSDESDQTRRVWGPGYINIPGMRAADSLGGRGIGRMRPTSWLAYNLYENADMRNSRFNFRRKYWYNDPSSPNFGKEVDATKFDTLRVIFPHSTKWYHFEPRELILTRSWKDRIMMRLGETYLLLAEAQFMQGKTDLAATNINAIRARSGVASIAASEVTLDFILDERARELFAEEDRRLTLVRTGTLISRVQRFNPTSAMAIKPHNVLLPIPQQEIDLNKDAALAQNTGY